jgi:hypothetical protein
VPIGYRRLLASGLRDGAAGTFSAATLESGGGLSSIDVDIAAFGLYGSYVFQNGAFQAGQPPLPQSRALGWTFMAKRQDGELDIGFRGSSLSTTV